MLTTRSSLVVAVATMRCLCAVNTEVSSSIGFRMVAGRVALWMGVVSCCLAGVELLTLSNPLAAQEGPAFDVASVRRNNGTFRLGDPSSMPTFSTQGRRFVAVNMDLRSLISYAYALEGFERVEGSARVLDERFDVIAIAGHDVTPAAEPDEFEPMLQALLAERFGLELRWEERASRVAALVLARTDGRPGPGLRPTSVDCDALQEADSVPEVTSRQCRFTTRNGRLHVVGRRMPEFARHLSRLVQHEVVDRTGLRGPFEIEMTHSWEGLFILPGLPAEELAQRLPGGAGGSALSAILSGNRASLSTALESELGLKLESQQGVVRVLVVERVGPLVEN